MRKKHVFLFFGALLSVVLFFMVTVGAGLTCDVFPEKPDTYMEAFERANDFYSRGEIKEFLYLYLWKPEQCYALALEMYSRALGIEPNHADALANRASAHLKLEQYDKAIDDYREILEINPQDQHARLGIALAYEKSGQLELAVLEYEAAIVFMKGSGYWVQLHPDSINEYQMRLRNLGEILAQETSK